MSSPTGTQFTIAYGAFRAVITEVGATLRVFELAGTPYAETFAEDAQPPLGCGQVLAPWPNRVADGEWEFHGAQQQLDLTEPSRHNAIHGLVRHEPWQVVEHVESAITLRVDIPVQPGWPVPLRTVIKYILDEGGLTVTHEMHNIGDQEVPFGIGSHVYPRTGNLDIDDCILRLAASTHLPLDDERLLPAGPQQEVTGTEVNFRAGRLLRGVVLDDAFGGCLPSQDGKVHHMLAGPQHAVEVWADPVFRWVQVYTATEFPGRGRAVAIEPMTCPPDALNSGVDLIRLPAGGSWSASWGLAPQVTSAEYH